MNNTRILLIAAAVVAIVTGFAIYHSRSSDSEDAAAPAAVSTTSTATSNPVAAPRAPLAPKSKARAPRRASTVDDWKIICHYYWNDPAREAQCMKNRKRRIGKPLNRIETRFLRAGKAGKVMTPEQRANFEKTVADRKAKRAAARAKKKAPQETN